jgi:DNA uptake protein ComE-like DNA-binding protein
MPSTPAERRALAVIAAIAALGVVARVVRSRHAQPQPTAAEVLALDQQIARVREARTSARSGGARPRSARRSTPRDSSSTRPASQPQREVVPVDLDTAGLAAIERLPWIGPSLAARIVESRERCGPFGSMEALTRVYGIGEGMAKRLAPHVTFSTPSRPMDATRTTACAGSAKSAAPRRRVRS